MPNKAPLGQKKAQEVVNNVPIVYLQVSRPVVSRFKDTIRLARTILFIIYALLLLYRLPIFIAELQITTHPLLRIQRWPDATEQLSAYRVAYHSLLDPLLSNLLPFGWMCVFSLLTLCEIIRRKPFGYGQMSIDSGSSVISGGVRRGSSVVNCSK
jgi:hypothetical protein